MLRQTIDARSLGQPHQEGRYCWVFLSAWLGAKQPWQEIPSWQPINILIKYECTSAAKVRFSPVLGQNFRTLNWTQVQVQPYGWTLDRTHLNAFGRSGSRSNLVWTLNLSQYEWKWLIYLFAQRQHVAYSAHHITYHVCDCTSLCSINAYG